VTTAREVAAYLDELLSVATMPDYPPALNGLQLDHRGPLVGIAAAVDFSRRTLERAVAAGANLLVVHHGMFWGGLQRVVGSAYERLHLAMAHDVAVYSVHLPLDAHATMGNNVLLAAELGLVPNERFAAYHGSWIGVRGDDDLPTRLLVERAATFAAKWGGQVVSTPCDASRRTRRWAICTGAGASSDTVREAHEGGVDTLVVGEGPHHTAVDALDTGLVIVYAGHYATEVLGVQTLARHASERFGLPWTFVHVPTGL
jgi:dinuclear metal center YbgI/SA1388 family protein